MPPQPTYYDPNIIRSLGTSTSSSNRILSAALDLTCKPSQPKPTVASNPIHWRPLADQTPEIFTPLEQCRCSRPTSLRPEDLAQSNSLVSEASDFETLEAASTFLGLCRSISPSSSTHSSLADDVMEDIDRHLPDVLPFDIEAIISSETTWVFDS